MNTKSAVLKKFKNLCELKYTGSTPTNYEYHVRMFLDFSKKPPFKLSNEDILNYNIYIRHKSVSYRNIAINAIKAFFYLVLKKRVKDFSSIRPKKQIKTTKYFDYNSVKSKILSVKNSKHRALLIIGLMGWLRVGEVINLKCRDIRTDIMMIRVLQSKGAKDRNVVMHQELLDHLKIYAREFLEGNLADSYLFAGQNGGKYSSSSCNALVKKHISANMRYHDLRATGSTYAHLMGVSLLDISKNLGHAKIETTKFYIPDIRESLRLIC